MIFIGLLAGPLLLHYYDPDLLAPKRILMIGRIVTSHWYGDAIDGSGNE